ncbi:hypothetical protein ABPG75_010344 [Micractinium tetrahymenae]
MKRRGGFGDAGGVTAGGALPRAAPLAVGTEAELRSELERVAAQLAPAVEWTARVDALLRLEGLVKGGAASWPAFPDLLAALLRDPLAAQLQERRSAVSRQACHAVTLLAQACGPAFEPLAMHLLPVLFRTLAMGIQVVTEAADACACAMLAACPSQRLLPRLLGTLASDKNGRLRQAAAEYLLVALERWDPAEWERQLEAVEKAVLAATGDAQGETRAMGRALFAAFARAAPAAAAAALARLGERDRALQEKLAAAVAAARECGPGMLSEGPSRRSSLGNSGAATPRGLSRSSSLQGAGPACGQQTGNSLAAVRLAPPVPKLALGVLGGSAAGSARGSPSHPSSARSASSGSHAQTAAWQPATARENQPENRGAGAAVQATPRSMFPKTFARREAAAAEGEAEAGESGRPAPPPAAGRERLGLRRSLGGAALRMSIAAFRSADGGDEPAAQLGSVAAAAPRAAVAQRSALRAPLPPLQLSQLPAEGMPQQQEPHEQAGGQAGRPTTARRLGALERQASSIPEDTEASSLSSGWDEGGVAPAASLAPLLAALGKPGVAWSDKVCLFQQVQAALQQSGGSSNLAADCASNADRLVAALLEGSGDAHFRVAAAALAALAAGLASPCSRLFEPQLDRVMTALFARVVDPKEHIRQLVNAALSAVLQQQSADATVAALARSLAANRAPKVKCAVLDFFAAAAGSDAGSEEAAQQAPPLLAQLTGSAALPGLLRSLLQLSTDKNPDIRRAAAEAVAAAYHAGAAQAVLACVHALPPADVLAVQRAIGPAIQRRSGSSSSGGGMNGDDAAAPAPPRRGSKAASAQPSALNSRRHSGEGLKQLGPPQQQQPALQRTESSSGSLTARSRQGSQQLVAPPAAAPGQEQQQQPPEHTPEPPSPFAWQATPPPCAAAAEPSAEGQQAAAAQAPAPAVAPPAATAGAGPALLPSDLAPFDDVMAGQLQRLLSQLEAGPSSEALQGLSRLAHVLPASAWPPCFDQINGAVCAALDGGSPVQRDAALMLARDLAAAAQPSLFLPCLPALLPRLLDCAAEQGAREVAAAADEALEQLLARLPPQSCLGLLAPRLPAPGSQLGTDRQAGARLHAAVRSLQRVVCRMQPAGLTAHLQPLLLPGLCAAYCSPLADVRKSTVDCLVAIWLVVGDALRPHLEPLSASQMRLLGIYLEKARAAGAQSTAGS